MEVELSSRKTTKERRIEELLDKLQEGDTLIVSELSRLGRSTSEVIDTVNRLIDNGVRFIAIKQGINLNGNHDMQSKVMVTMFSLFAELERDIISNRTKAALAKKKSEGVKLGKPKGTIQESKLDPYQEEIKALLKCSVSKASIAKIIGAKCGGCSREHMSKYIQSRKLD